MCRRVACQRAACRRAVDDGSTKALQVFHIFFHSLCISWSGLAKRLPRAWRGRSPQRRCPGSAARWSAACSTAASRRSPVTLALWLPQSQRRAAGARRTAQWLHSGLRSPAAAREALEVLAQSTDEPSLRCAICYVDTIGTHSVLLCTTCLKWPSCRHVLILNAWPLSPHLSTSLCILYKHSVLYMCTGEHSLRHIIHVHHMKSITPGVVQRASIYGSTTWRMRREDASHQAGCKAAEVSRQHAKNTKRLQTA